MKPKTPEQYLATVPQESLAMLKMLRDQIKRSFPEAFESVSYGLLGYKVAGKPLVYIGGYKKHIGVYALPATHRRFKHALSGYKQGKGSVQLPLNQPLPVGLITEMINFRLNSIDQA